MKSTTPAPSVSIPQGVYDLETLKTECDALVLQPTRPNIRRVRRALALVDTPNAISNLANFDDGMKLYSVQSQSHPDSSYIVRSHGTYECTCPDYGKGNICTLRSGNRWNAIHQLNSYRLKLNASRKRCRD